MCHCKLTSYTHSSWLTMANPSEWKTFFLSPGGDDSLPDLMPLRPNPLPADAFAHIRAEEQLDSISVPLGRGGEEGSIFATSTKFVDILSEILPRRRREFRSFVRKV